MCVCVCVLTENLCARFGHDVHPCDTGHDLSGHLVLRSALVLAGVVAHRRSDYQLGSFSVRRRVIGRFRLCEHNGRDDDDEWCGTHLKYTN